MSTQILIHPGVGIGPFKLGQSFRDVVNLQKEFREITQPSSIEYSDTHPFHQHLIIRSHLHYSGCQYQLLLAFEPFLQNLHFLKLSLHDSEQDLLLQYNKENDVMRISIEQQEGYKPMQNLSQLLKAFRKKRFRIEDLSEKNIKILEIFGDECSGHLTKYLFRYDGDEDTFLSLSSIKTDVTQSVMSEIPRVDTVQYKLTSIVILSDTYTTQTHLAPSRNLTPQYPIYKYNSTNDYLHFSNRHRTYTISCSSNSQEILTYLGTPATTHYTKSQHKPASYFYNYKSIGLDLMFSCLTHKVSMIVLHNNIPGHADFNEYARAFFTVSHLLFEDEYFDLSSDTNWQSLSVDNPILGEIPSVTVSRQGNANSLYPFPPTALVHLSNSCLLEIHDSGYISNVFISTNFSHPRLLNNYTHKRLNILKQAQISEITESTQEEESLTTNPFVEEIPLLFDAEFSAQSNAVKYAYKKLPDLEEDYALYSYNPYMEPQHIPFKLQKAQSTDRTNYLLKRVEVSGKTAQVKNRVKFVDITYIPPCVLKADTQKNIPKQETSKGVIIEDNEMNTNGHNLVASENEVIFDMDMNYYHEEIDAFQSNGVVSRESPTISEVTEPAPLSTVTTDSRMYSLRSDVFQSTTGQVLNGFSTPDLDPQLSIQSNISRRSTLFDLSSEPADFQTLIEDATQEEIDFPSLLKSHALLHPILTERLIVYTEILPLWSSGKNQKAIDVLSAHTTLFSQSDPQFYSHLILLLLTKEFNWTIKTSQFLLDSLVDWISVTSPDYQLETTCSVIQLVIKRFRVRLIGNEPINKTLREQFATFTTTLYHVYTRLESIINQTDVRSISEKVLKMITACHHDLRLFKSKFPVS